MNRSRVPVLAVASIVATVAPVAAQSSIHYGPLLGVAWAQWQGQGANGAVFPRSYNPGVRTGFVGGGFLRYQAADRVVLEPQLLFAQKGAQFDSAGVTGTVALDYIEVPILLKVTLPTAEKRVEPSVFVGSAVGFQVGCKVEPPLPPAGAPPTCGDFQIGGHSSDVSAVFGLGLDAWRLAFQLRYDLGLSHVGTEAGHEVKNKAWLFTVGYRFGR